VPPRPYILISCEHGGNEVPPRFAQLLDGAEGVLEGHRGWDPGALAISRRLAGALGAPLFHTAVTRLLVDCNRSLHSPTLFTEFSRALSPDARAALLRKYYHPHRDAVAAEARRAIEAGGRAVHLSMHTFTPMFNGLRRSCDVGLLYDPSRPLERSYCADLKGKLSTIAPGLRVRRNYPYRGTYDALVTTLRRELPAESYLGIEIEMNQEFPVRDPAGWEGLQDAVVAAVKEKTERE